MKVRSPLADMDVAIGEIRRVGNDLVVSSGPDSSMDATITVSAHEVAATLRKLLASPSVLLFVLALPWFRARQVRGSGAGSWTATARPADINKPW